MRETLVFLAGTLCDERVFAPQLLHFEEHYECHVLIPQGSKTMEEMARATIRMIEAPHAVNEALDLWLRQPVAD